MDSRSSVTFLFHVDSNSSCGTSYITFNRSNLWIDCIAYPNTRGRFPYKKCYLCHGLWFYKELFFWDYMESSSTSWIPILSFEPKNTEDINNTGKQPHKKKPIEL